ncbi:MAG: hypothetical protein E7577_02715 [Ruminococcaceae bacterium]|nr:hypothetical protein [Oscillospiraceae bacterium]
MKRKDKSNESRIEPLSSFEEEMIRESVREDRKKRKRLTYYDNSDKAKFGRYVKHNPIFAVICIVLAVCLTATLVISVSFALVKHFKNKPNTSDFTVLMGDEELVRKYRDCVRDGVTYIDMYAVAEYAGFITSGNPPNSVKFTGNMNNYLRFENESAEAIVNGVSVELDEGRAYITEDTCDVPVSFLIKALEIGTDNGLRVTLDTETNTIKVRRRYYEPDKDNVSNPVNILFSSDNFKLVAQFQIPEAPDPFGYTIDIEPYILSIDPENNEEYLLLANKESPLGKDYKPANLTKLECKVTKDEDHYLREDAALALYAMMLEMSIEGINDVSVTSSYRSYANQSWLFGYYKEKHMKEGMTEAEAEAAVLVYSARPGTSEHQTGLCVDFTTDSIGGAVDDKFESTAAFEWLSENAYKYGFILRYPKDKTNVTGYKYESWHYRFVGRTAAVEIQELGVCLEEYLEIKAADATE